MTCDTKEAFGDDKAKDSFCRLSSSLHSSSSSIGQSWQSKSQNRISSNFLFMRFPPLSDHYHDDDSQLRWRKRQQVDDSGSSIGSTIVYSIEQVENAVHIFLRMLNRIFLKMFERIFVKMRENN